MASTYLTRTPSSAGNRKTWTFSAWIKRSDTASQVGVLNTQPDSSNYTRIRFGSNKLRVLSVINGSTGSGFDKETSRVFRDNSAFYNIVIAYNSTLATSNDRVKIWVNGVLETDFSINSFGGGQNLDSFVNATNLHDIGAEESASYFNGLMSHIHLIDGTAYDASAFGETDATTGEWKIKTSPSVTYGTNGFFILKDGNSVTDQSGNGNNWTVAGGTLTNTEDCPSNVFATWNPFTCRPDYVFSNQFGNTRWRHSEANSHHSVRSTLGFNSGKYYAEFKVVSNVSNSSMQIGISSLNTANTPDTAVFGLEGSGYQNNGVLYRNGYSDVTGLTTFAQNDIIGVACDFDNKMIYWYKNGTLLNGTGYAFSLNGGIAEDDFYGFACSGYQTSGDDVVIDANFGNGYFNNTAVSSAGTNASGNGIFEYDVPTGYTALSTKGLNL
jgi:hypothetical protein